MGKKLTEKNGWELTAALAELAGPVGRMAENDKLWDCVKRCTAKGVNLKQSDTMRFILQTYAELFPMLFDDEHRMDTFTIISVVEGIPLKEAMEKPGMEILRDIVDAYNQQLKGFFTNAAPSGQTE